MAASERYPIETRLHKGEPARGRDLPVVCSARFEGEVRVPCVGGCIAALAGCGGDDERQDANEPEGDYKVEVVEASFPADQKLAKRSELVIVVRNADTKQIPNIAVTMKGLDYRKDDPDLADQRRPQFVVNGKFKNFGNIEDAQAQTPGGVENPTYVDTWSLGPLEPGESKEFKWDVTAVVAGPYELELHGRGGPRRQGAGDRRDTARRPQGIFTGTVSDEAPQTRIADDGKTIVDVEDERPLGPSLLVVARRTRGSSTHRQARVLRQLRMPAHGEGRSARVADQLLPLAGIAEPRFHPSTALTSGL